ncbi:MULTISPECIES: FAD-binding oxidoreductase [Streptomyces]|uniref:FAD-binding oxidoreductase n=1 Tax=Streptomyces TaxID=1883 RepID=UPI00163C9D4C|nr:MULTISPECIES: FAD-binding oxidoreductase [Streptomyces]MBC2879663.1 FAD-binding oxidoreductase [Streptomyces sp. TYQ1024]UBI35088.1 FAD-binding oxidoreductase [Streptomyces mobaraensis]UKW27681.1 FAD-binding oxidoreductase [Streptomyces sp. TYQ1024]
MREFSRDFGRTSAVPPERVVREGEDGTIGHLMRQAGATGRETAVRGAGRSCNTQTLSPGTVLDNYRPDALPRFTGDDHSVAVPSGITWLELEKWLNRHGRSNPVLPSYLDITVGGNLSVGGFGLASVRSGIQSDQVREIELIDGTGRARRCSERENGELFRFALGGLGQVGFISEVVLRTVPYRPVTRAARIPHTGLADLVDFMRNGAQDPAVASYFGMYDRTDWYSYVSYDADIPDPAGPAETQPVPDYMLYSHGETTKKLHHLLEEDTYANLWVDHILAPSGFPGFCARVEELTHEYPLSDTLVALYFLVIRRPPAATRFVLAPVVDAPVQYLIGIFTAADRSDSRAISGTRRVLRELLEACADAGGRPYLYGTHDFDAELLERFYGAPALRRLEELRGRLSLTHFNRRAFGGFRP